MASKTEVFRNQHADIINIVKEVEQNGLAPGKLPANAAKVRVLLNKLSGKVSIHLAMEDDALYPRLLQHQDAEVKNKAKKFIDEMGGIKNAYLDYNKKWTQSAIEMDSPAFVKETTGLFGALGDRIKRENNDLYALVDKLG